MMNVIEIIEWNVSLKNVLLIVLMDDSQIRVLEQDAKKRENTSI